LALSLGDVGSAAHPRTKPAADAFARRSLNSASSIGTPATFTLPFFGRYSADGDT
jgi:hypothetical protein